MSEDFNAYHRLARAEVLHAATGGEPERSARFRELLRPGGWDDELRAILRDGDEAELDQWRAEHRPPPMAPARERELLF